jgi:hypothetical protein
MSPRLFDVAVTVRAWLSPPPAVIPERLTVCAAASSAIAAGVGMAFTVGASFTALTVRTNDLSVTASPSLTAMVIVAASDGAASGRLATGVTVTVRLPPVPPSTIVLMSAGFVVADADSVIGLPSSSETVKARAPVDVSSLIV